MQDLTPSPPRRRNWRESRTDEVRNADEILWRRTLGRHNIRILLLFIFSLCFFSTKSRGEESNEDAARLNVLHRVYSIFENSEYRNHDALKDMFGFESFFSNRDKMWQLYNKRKGFIFNSYYYSMSVDGTIEIVDIRIDKNEICINSSDVTSVFGEGYVYYKYYITPGLRGGDSGNLSEKSKIPNENDGVIYNIKYSGLFNGEIFMNFMNSRCLMEILFKKVIS